LQPELLLVLARVEAFELISEEITHRRLRRRRCFLHVIFHVHLRFAQFHELRRQADLTSVFVDRDDFSFQNLSENVQTVEGTVVLKLGFAPFSSSGQATPTTYKEKAIEYYDIEWNLNKAMQGWTPGDDYGYLSRSTSITEKRSDAIRVREIRYRIAFEDYSTANVIQYVPAAAVIEPEIVTE